jgi:hypothetical protein
MVKMASKWLKLTIKSVENGLKSIKFGFKIKLKVERKKKKKKKNSQSVQNEKKIY